MHQNLLNSKITRLTHYDGNANLGWVCVLFLQDVGFQNKRKIFILFISEEFKVSNLNVKKEDLKKLSQPNSTSTGVGIDFKMGRKPPTTTTRNF